MLLSQKTLVVYNLFNSILFDKTDLVVLHINFTILIKSDTKFVIIITHEPPEGILDGSTAEKGGKIKKINRPKT